VLKSASKYYVCTALEEADIEHTEGAWEEATRLLAAG